MRLKTFGNRISAMLALLLVATFFLSSSAVHAATTSVITPADVATQPESVSFPSKNWVGYFRNGGSYAFQNGPATPPLGNGSLRLNTPTGSDKETVFNFEHIGVKLSDINTMGYSTYLSQVNP